MPSHSNYYLNRKSLSLFTGPRVRTSGSLHPLASLSRPCDLKFPCLIFYPRLWWKRLSPHPWCPLWQNTIPRVCSVLFCENHYFFNGVYRTFLKPARVCGQQGQTRRRRHLLQAVYAEPHGHGNFTGDLFVWELHWNTGCWCQF